MTGVIFVMNCSCIQRIHCLDQYLIGGRLVEKDYFIYYSS